MQSIIIFDTHEELPPILEERSPYPLLPVAGRPLAELLVESSIEAGATDVILVSSSKPEITRKTLGDGSRWGIRLDVVTPFAKAEQTLTAYTDIERRRVFFPCPMLVSPHDLRLLLSEHPENTVTALTSKTGTPFYYPSGTPFENITFPDITSNAPLTVTPVQFSYSTPRYPVFPLYSLSHVYQANMAFLQGDLPYIRTPAKEEESGIFIGHHTRIAPSAKLIPPVCIGPFTTIGQGSRIGPHAVIGSSCIIDDHAEIIASVLTDDTFAGPHTHHENVFAAGRIRFDMDQNTCVLVPDSFIQGESVKREQSQLSSRIVHRVLAAFLACVSSPLLLFLWIANKGSFTRFKASGMEVLETLECAPQPEEITLYTVDFGGTFLRSVPMLLDAAKGTIRCIGPEPLRPSEAAQLTTSWERVRFQTKPGVIPPWCGLANPPIDDMEKKTYNSWYASNPSLKTDLKTLWGVITKGWRHLIN